MHMSDFRPSLSKLPSTYTLHDTPSSYETIVTDIQHANCFIIGFRRLG